MKEAWLSLAAGEIHALLGPNGAGKTTLLRILSGVLTPTRGDVRVMGADVSAGSRAVREQLGTVPSGDRSFYLRLSGLENLAFFARMHGMRRKEAVARASEVLEAVGLHDVGSKMVGVYSHGMQKRLSIGRALLTSPALLLVDEATHDLDPAGARSVRALVRELAERGTTVVWATQRIEEIRGFADGVTLINAGEIRFQGSVPELMDRAVPRQYLLRLRNGRAVGADLSVHLERSLSGKGIIAPASEEDPERYRLALQDGVVLGDALSSLAADGIDVLSCREERSEIEEAFLSLTTDERG